MTRLRFFLFLTCATFGAGTSGAASAADKHLMFGARELVEQISLSPDGQNVAYITPAGGTMSALVVAAIDTGKATPIVKSDGKPFGLEWCEWASNTRLVCSSSGIVGSGSDKMPFTRLTAMNLDGSQQTQLGERNSFRSLYVRQFDGNIIDWHADDRGGIMMSRYQVPEQSVGTYMADREEGLAVDLIDTVTLKRRRVEKADRIAVNYLSDGTETIRLKEQQPVAASGYLTGDRSYRYRLKGQTTWRPFEPRSDGNWSFVPIEVDRQNDAVFAWGKRNGRTALFRVSLDEAMKPTLVLSDDRVDIDDVVRLGPKGRIVGATFVTDVRQTVYFDPELKKLAANLSKALPGQPIIRFVSASLDEQKLLIFAGSDVDPGRYYIYDKQQRRLNESLLARPDLEKVPLANVKPVSFPASDGTMIPGYLTLPPGSDGKASRAVVMPHGGPGARDEWGFDWLAQYFAAQGYAVLQPNFRGSTGYGDDWMNENGIRGWRTAVGDIVDAGRWMVAQKIVDENRLGIVGWSYGGYAALQSGVIAPELFKGIVAIAPVTDFRMMIDQSKRFTNANLVKDFVGSGAHITEGSPLRNVDRIAAPVLMFSGDMDLNVDIAQSRAMERALEKAGKSGRLVVYPGLEHGLADSSARADMLKQADAFLRQAIPDGSTQGANPSGPLPAPN